jgi:hypothetical protein
VRAAAAATARGLRGVSAAIEQAIPLGSRTGPRFESRPPWSAIRRRHCASIARRIDRAPIVASCGAGDGRVALIFRSTRPRARCSALKAGKVYVPVDPSYPASRSEPSSRLRSGLVLTTKAARSGRSFRIVPVSNVDEPP